MAIRYHNPAMTFGDNNNDPLSGALLYFYEAGTTTPLDTFSDEDLTTANANPVVADSAGKFGDIWLREQAYKVILKTSADVTVTTTDPWNGNLAISGDDFKVSPQDPADMTVDISAGTLYDLTTKTRVSKTAQTSGTITAPSVDPRIDVIYIDQLSGVIGITTGSEAASPSVPTIPDGKLPLAQIALAITTTEITDSLITDIRELANIGSPNFLDEDDMASDSATAVSSQQAIKAYVESRGIDIQSGTASGTWTKPSGYAATSRVLVQLWASGASGGFDASPGGSGGGGGGYVETWFALSALGATETVTINAAGTAVTSASVGVVGGNATFGSLLTAYGGGAGGGNGADNGGGGGGGSASVGGDGTGTAAGAGGSPGGAAGSTSVGGNGGFGGGGGGHGDFAGGAAAWGGGGGGGAGGGSANDTDGGASYYGGGGGGGAGTGAGSSGGVSTLGGNGGAGGNNGAGTDGTAPGGGGGGAINTTSGAGALGQWIVTVFGA